MNTITDLFQQAQLAEAAYANFLDPKISYLDALINESSRVRSAHADFNAM